MPQEQAQEERRRSAILEKAAYSRAAQKRLSEAEITLTGVKAKIRSATTAGQIAMNRQLEDGLLAVDANLASVKTALDRLRKSGCGSWKKHSREVDTAWENLSQSIKRLVAGYSDGKQ